MLSQMSVILMDFCLERFDNRGVSIAYSLMRIIRLCRLIERQRAEVWVINLRHLYHQKVTIKRKML